MIQVLEQILERQVLALLLALPEERQDNIMRAVWEKRRIG